MNGFSLENSEKELDSLERQLLDKDFDPILFTKILGSKDQLSLLKSIAEWSGNNGHFNDDYLIHQGFCYEPGYYDKYTVFHAEASLYCICRDKKRSLIWRGGIDITDPSNIEKTIGEYVKLVILALEDQDLICTKQRDEVTGL